MAAPTAPAISESELRKCVEKAGLDLEPEQLRWRHVGRFSNDIWRADLNSNPVLIAKQSYRQAQPDGERAFYRAISKLAQLQESALPIPRYLGEIDGILLLEFQAARQRERSSK